MAFSFLVLYQPEIKANNYDNVTNIVYVTDFEISIEPEVQVYEIFGTIYFYKYIFAESKIKSISTDTKINVQKSNNVSNSRIDVLSINIENQNIIKNLNSNNYFKKNLTIHFKQLQRKNKFYGLPIICHI